MTNGDIQRESNTRKSRDSSSMSVGSLLGILVALFVLLSVITMSHPGVHVTPEATDIPSSPAEMTIPPATRLPTPRESMSPPTQVHVPYETTTPTTQPAASHETMPPSTPMVIPTPTEQLPSPGSGELDLATLVDNAASLLKDGMDAFNPPAVMMHRKTYLVEYRVLRGITDTAMAKPTLVARMTGTPAIGDVQVSPIMAVRLTGSDFEITPLTIPEEQLVWKDEPASWHWGVRPLRSGVLTLTLGVNARIIAEGLGERSHDLGVKSVSVRVLVNPMTVFVDPAVQENSWKWLFFAAVGALASLAAAIKGVPALLAGWYEVRDALSGKPAHTPRRPIGFLRGSADDDEEEK